MGLLAQCVEKRDHPSNPSQQLLYALSGGVDTTSGISVSEDTALNIPAVFSCVRIIAETIGSIPLHVYKRREPRGKDRAPGHNLYDLLHTQPNPQMTAMQWRETMAGHTALWGNSYSEIEYDNNGKIKAFWPLRPDQMRIKRNGGRLWYFYVMNGAEHMLADYQVLHVPGFGFDGIQGYSIVAKAREAMGMAQATEKFGASFFGRGAKPSGVFTHPQALSSKARKGLKKGVVEAIGGLSNVNRLLILEEGMKWEQIGLSQEDSQFLQTRKFQLAEIARMFRMPLHKLQEMDKATFSNIEQQAIEFVTDTMMPWFVRFEQCYTTQLLTAAERKRYFVEHLILGLLRGDTESRYKAYNTGRLGGWLSTNDIRELENQNPIPEEEGGDAYLVPLNTAPLKLVASGMIIQSSANTVEEKNNIINGVFSEVKALPGDNGQERRSQQILDTRLSTIENFRELFHDAIQRIVNKEVKALQNATKKIWGQRAEPINEFNKWVDEFYIGLTAYVDKIIIPPSKSFSRSIFSIAGSEVGAGPLLTPEMEGFVKSYLVVFTKRYIGSSRGQLLKLLKETSPQEVSNVLLKRSNDWMEKKAKKIAEDEVIRQSNAVALETYKRAGILYKKWVAGPGACVFCRALAEKYGTKVPIDGLFGEEGGKLYPLEEGLIGSYHVGAATFMGITGPKAHPPIHRGCKCSVVPILEF